MTYPQRAFSGFAIASFVLSVIACVPLGLILGIVALVKDRELRGRGLAIAGIAVSLAWLVVVPVATWLFVFGDGYTQSDGRWSVGDCIPEVSKYIGRSSEAPVDCAQSHAGEVVALLDLGEYDKVSDDEEQRRCQVKLAEYAAPEHRGASIYLWQPSTPEMKGDNYSVICVAVSDPPRTGSIKG
jgi:hypothetical protein